MSSLNDSAAPSQPDDNARSSHDGSLLHKSGFIGLYMLSKFVRFQRDLSQCDIESCHAEQALDILYEVICRYLVCLHGLSITPRRAEVEWEFVVREAQMIAGQQYVYELVDLAVVDALTLLTPENPLVRAVWGCMSNLTEYQRFVVYYRHMLGKPKARIADMLELNPSTVGCHLEGAGKKLHRSLAEVLEAKRLALLAAEIDQSEASDVSALSRSALTGDYAPKGRRVIRKKRNSDSNDRAD